jgi:colicin import membrane protein
MYIVKDGYSFSTKRGILKPGDEITEKDFVSHEAFVKAVSRGKIIAGKSPEQLEKEAAELAKKEQAEIEAAAAKEKGKALVEAKKKQETALAALQAARNALSHAESVLKTENAARADAEAKVALARETAAALEGNIPNHAALRQAVADAEAKLQNAKKPAEKEAADAKAALILAEGANNDLAAARKALADAEAELEKAETAKTESEAKTLNAREAITLAEAELQGASAELAAMEGK